MNTNIVELKALAQTIGMEASEEQLQALVKAVTAKKTKASEKNYQVLKTEFAAKTPLQMKQCVLALESAGRDDEPVPMSMWCELLEQYEGFTTRQSAAKIIAFYRKRMLDEGLVAVV
jgi:hypothetical protein